MEVKWIVAMFLLATIPNWTNGLPPAQNYSASQLQKDLEEFLELIPTKKIQILAIQYFIKDKEFRGLLTFAKGADFKEFWVDIFSKQTTQTFVDFGQKNGADLVGIINSIADALDVPRYPSTFDGAFVSFIEGSDVDKISGGIKGFFKDMEKLLPKEKLKKLFDEKCGSNPVFKQWFGLLDFDRLERYFKTSQVAVKVLKFFEKYYVDLKHYFDLLKKGLSIPK